MSYLRSRYLMRGNQVVPVAFRSDFSLYYLGYFLIGGILALIVTLGLRRRLLACSKRSNWFKKSGLLVPVAQDRNLRHHGGMTHIDKRHYPRRRVNLHAVVARQAPPTAVIDLSEGGAALEWNLPGEFSIGSKVRLRFLLAAEQSLEIEGRIVRVAGGRAGVEFVSEQQNLVRQLMAETKSED